METKDWEPKRRLVTLPSGRQVQIRKPGTTALMAMLGTLPVLDVGNGDADAAQQIQKRLDTVDVVAKFEFTAELVVRCSIEPRFHRDDPAPVGHISLADIENDDFWALADQILEFGDLKGQAAKVGPTSASPAS